VERLLLLRNASATELQQDILACMYVSVCMGFQKVRRLDDSLLPCRLLPAGLGRVGEEGPALRLRSSAWAAALAETWELLLALAGNAGGRYDALLRRRLGCYVADCV
jgi:hypothetical protein